MMRSNSFFIDRKNIFWLALILLATFFSFYPSLNNGFTGWDDTTHLTLDPVIRSLSFENIQKMFTRSINATYIPLTSLSFAVEYHFFQKDPFIYHLNNLLLHLIVTWLVFVLGKKMGLSLRAAGLAALLFGIHPMRVESVAWITERKDVLYASFYMASLVFYWQYLEEGKKKFYIFSLMFASLSILSKAMALSLPLILFVLDFHKKRQWNKSLLLEKIPFFFVIVSVAMITYVQNIRPQLQGWWEASLIWVWTFSFYPIKFIFTFHLSPIYKLPHPISILNAPYGIAVFLFIFFFLMLYQFRRHRWVWLAVLFYFWSIFFLLRFNDVSISLGPNIVADRFLYLPSVGFCFLFGHVLDQWIVQYKKLRWLIYVCSAVIFIWMGVATYGQCQIWKSNFTLWDYTIRTTPTAELAYLNRGEEYIQQQRYDLAMADTQKAVDLRPGYAKAHNNKGNLYFYGGQYNLAQQEYRIAIMAEPSLALTYNNRGVLASELGQYELALKDFEKSIELDPNDSSTYSNRANVYTRLGRYTEAQEDCTQALVLNSDNAAAYHSRGNLSVERGQLDFALSDFSRAIDLDPKSFKSFNNRCNIHYRKKEYIPAIEDCNSAVHLNSNYPAAYVNRGLVYYELKKFGLALKDFERAQQLGISKLEKYILDMKKKSSSEQ